MIIGLSGRKQSGKSTLGAALEKELGFKQLAFADGVREFVAAAFGWDLARVYGDSFKSTDVLQVQQPGYSNHTIPMSGRELLQRIGTDAARKVFGEDCWVNVGMHKCKTALGLTATTAAQLPRLVTAIVGDVLEEMGDGLTAGMGSFLPKAKVETIRAGLQVELAELIEQLVREGIAAGVALHAGVTVDDLLLTGDQKRDGESDNYVFTDVRFPNELRAIQAAGGKVLRLNTMESWATFHAYAQAEEAHEEDGMCRYRGQGPDGTLRDCSLPRAAHPCAFPIDRHASECSLPDMDNVTIHYDAIETGSLVENTKSGLVHVRHWLGKRVNKSVPDGAASQSSLKNNDGADTEQRLGYGAEGAAAPAPPDADGATGVDKQTKTPDAAGAGISSVGLDPAPAPVLAVYYLSAEQIDLFYNALDAIVAHATEMGENVASIYDKQEPIRTLCNVLLGELSLPLNRTRQEIIASHVKDDIGQGEGCEGGKCTLPEKKHE